MRILGIESSCDETAVAVYDELDGLLGHIVHTQAEMHAAYGGVVPELASRDHIRRLMPLIRQVLADAGTRREQLDGVAYTAGPGLVGALLVGASVGRSLAWAWQKPAVAVHHMEGHLLASMLESEAPTFPFVALLVSGGHTLLVSVLGVGRYQILGESLDDAVGEAFDKTAKLLGLPYPGGAALAELATTGTPGKFEFPRPMVNRPGLDFSFSGLKTAVANVVASVDDLEAVKADIACAFQIAVVETLAIKCRRAMEHTGFDQLIVAGGVGANQALRERLTKQAKAQGFQLFYPRAEFCTDNGAMIAYAGMQRLKAGLTEGLEFGTQPRWSLDTLEPTDTSPP